MLARALEPLAPGGRWWPYRDPFEIAVSAVLTQRTTWGSAARAMDALRAEGLLTPRALAGADLGRVERCIRQAGFYRQKARAVRAMARRLEDRFGGKWSALEALSTEELRRELRSWRGVGDETADAILLYAVGRPTFVVDAYTVRLMRRFGAVRGERAPAYGAVAEAWTRVGAAEPRRSKRLHSAIIEHSKAHCAAVPACATCPLRGPCAKVGVQQVHRNQGAQSTSPYLHVRPRNETRGPLFVQRRMLRAPRRRL